MTFRSQLCGKTVTSRNIKWIRSDGAKNSFRRRFARGFDFWVEQCRHTRSHGLQRHRICRNATAVDAISRFAAIVAHGFGQNFAQAFLRIVFILIVPRRVFAYVQTGCDNGGMFTRAVVTQKPLVLLLDESSRERWLHRMANAGAQMNCDSFRGIFSIHCCNTAR